MEQNTHSVKGADDFVKEYSLNNGFRIIRNKTSIIFKSTGFSVRVMPYLRSLYGTLSMLIEDLERRDTENSLTKDELEAIDGRCIAVCHILSLPLDVFSDSDFLIQVATTIQEQREIYYKRLTDEASVEKEETELDEIKNDAFFTQIAALETEKESVKS